LSATSVHLSKIEEERERRVMTYNNWRTYLSVRPRLLIDQV
jgi:hypothetical protein